MPIADVPLLGYKVTIDKEITTLPKGVAASDSWYRTFAPQSGVVGWDYWTITVQVRVFDSPKDAHSYVTAYDCAQQAQAGELIQEVSSVASGDVSKGCNTTFTDPTSGKTGRELVQMTATRNVGIVVFLVPRDRAVTDQKAFETVALFVQRQIDIVDRVAPR